MDTKLKLFATTNYSMNKSLFCQWIDLITFLQKIKVFIAIGVI
jgi:hypothetical protein